LCATKFEAVSVTRAGGSRELTLAVRGASIHENINTICWTVRFHVIKKQQPEEAAGETRF
jgi:hypothetical protein